MTGLCDGCGGKCCDHIIIEHILPQMNVGQFMDTVHWLELHEGISVSDINPDTRYCKLRIEVPCTNLVDGRCSDYEHRPLTCRVYVCPEGKQKMIKEALAKERR